MNRVAWDARGGWAPAMALLAVLAASGCQPEPPSGPPPKSASTTQIEAAAPADMAAGVTLAPVLRWKLPPALSSPDIVTVHVFEVGRVEDPRTAAGEKEIALAAGLAGQTELNLFSPPAGCVLTGDLSDRKTRQLAPDTWYHWHIRAVLLSDVSATGDFYFRTRAETGPALDTDLVDVLLVSRGNNKNAVIQEVSAATGLDFQKAKDLVDTAPVILRKGMPRRDAESFKRRLEQAGAIVELE